MNRIFFFFLTLMTIFSFSSCGDKNGPWEYIYIENNSNQRVYCVLQFNYPDTNLAQYGDNFSFSNHIKPFSKSDFPMPSSWEEQILLRNSDSTATFIFISEDTISKYGFEGVRNTYNILKRSELKTTDLKNLNGTVTYP